MPSPLGFDKKNRLIKVAVLGLIGYLVSLKKKLRITGFVVISDVVSKQHLYKIVRTLIIMVMGITSIVFTGVLAGVLLLVANGAYLFDKFKDYIADITTKSFFQIAVNIYDILPRENKISLLIQFIILIAATAAFAIYSSRRRKKPVLTRACFAKGYMECESRTDLDMLYRLLLSKQEVSISDVERLFKIDGDIALEWCKILENANLATIDYPNFQKPVVRLYEDVNKDVNKANQATKKIIDTVTGEKKVVIVEKTPLEKKVVKSKVVEKKVAVPTKPKIVKEVKVAQAKPKSIGKTTKPKMKKTGQKTAKPKVVKKVSKTKIRRPSGKTESSQKKIERKPNVSKKKIAKSKTTKKKKR